MRDSTPGYLAISAVMFALVAFAHLVRALEAWPMAIAGWNLPLAVSWIVAIATTALSAWALTLLRARR